MKRVKFTCALILFLAIGFSAGGGLSMDDWPQWRGADRDGLSKETGLLDSWPATGPPKVWTIDGLGSGYGTVSIHAGRIFVQGAQGTNSVVFCLDVSDGETIWAQTLGKSRDHGRGGGPRGTPVIDGDRLYALSEDGELVSLKLQDGSLAWGRNILKDFGGENPNWLVSESPLIDGDRLIVTPGGADASVVALNKMTGATVWTSRGLSDQAGYSSCIVEEVGGVRLIMAFTSRAAVGIRAVDGALMWQYKPVANRTANVATPVFHEDKVFYSSAYGTGAVLLSLKAEGDRVTAEEVYFTRDMQNHHGGVVLIDGYLYGFSGSILTCIDFQTGKQVWRDRSVGKGSLTYADGHLYLLGEGNEVGLAEATPKGYVEKGRFSIEDQGRPSWAHPVVSEGHLYIRNQGTLARYDIRAH